MGKLSWSVDCDTVSIGTDGCAAILAALDRASSAVQAQLFLLLGQTLVPAKALVRGPGGKLRSVPQALAKQLSINKPTVETEWDAMISVFVDEGFSFLDRTGGEGKPSFGGDYRSSTAMFNSS